MLIGLHDADAEHLKKKKHSKDEKKKFPNYALMKISAWHKSKGDTVQWWMPLYQYDQVYSSKIFDFTPVNQYLPESTIKGGTGYDIKSQLPPDVDNMFPDYSIYPQCDYAIGFLTRGCPNNCPWCYVPEKEGKIKSYRTWEELIRPDSNKLILMDNNILACGHGVQQLRALIDTEIRIDLNQGMDIRLVNEEHVMLFKRLKWIRYIRFSCDHEGQLPHFKRVMMLFKKHGARGLFLTDCN